MPKISANREDLEAPSAIPEGLYCLRLDGFAPKFSKDRGSTNLNPKLTVINHPTLNDRLVFMNLNTKGPWVIKDFIHALGMKESVLADGSVTLLNFNGPDDDPTRWQCTDPILGKVLQAYVIQADNTKGGLRNGIRSFICTVPGCMEKHSTNLEK